MPITQERFSNLIQAGQDFEEHYNQLIQIAKYVIQHSATMNKEDLLGQFQDIIHMPGPANQSSVTLALEAHHVKLTKRHNERTKMAQRKRRLHAQHALDDYDVTLTSLRRPQSNSTPLQRIKSPAQQQAEFEQRVTVEYDEYTPDNSDPDTLDMDI